MEDRRSAYPTKDTPEHNIFDGPVTRTENDPIHDVHRRYWMMLVVGVVCVGLYFFYTPASMTSALHCNQQETAFSYVIADGAYDTAADLPSTEAAALNAEAVDILKSYSTSHMLQQDAVFDSENAIVIYPDEDTNYALYATPDVSYVFALDKSKFRYQVKDDGNFYQLLEDALQLK